MYKGPASQTMGSGGGGIFSSTSSNSGFCSHSNQNGSIAGSSTSTNSNVRCECVKCTYCQNNLGHISVKCSECFNFHLCLKCFSMSAEIGDHKKDHNYFLKSTTSFPLFDSENLWTYKEELHLLQFIEQYGFDNWEEIGKHLPNRTAEECMQHYHSYYIYGNLGKNTFASNLKNKLEATFGFSNDTEFKIEDPTLDNKSEMTTTVLLPPIEMSLEEQRALGYMPLRDDFEREYKNDGEQLLSNLTIANNQLALLNDNLNIEKLSIKNTDHSFSSSGAIPSTPSKQESNPCNIDPDDVVDFEIKFTLIEMYRECLQERQRFKKIAREYGLINHTSALLNKQKVVCAAQAPNGSLLAANGLSINHVSNKKRGRKVSTHQVVEQKECGEVDEKLKKYAQFMSVSDYEHLMENLRKQRQICKRIQELQMYRSQYGLQKMSDIEEMKREQVCKNSPLIDKSRKRKRKSYQMYANSPNKRLTRRQNNNSVLCTSVLSMGKMDNTLNETGLSDLNISNIRQFSPSSSRSSSRSSSSNRSRSNSRSNSSNSMNIYELVDQAKAAGEDLISDHRDEDIESENDENIEKEKIFTDEEDNENEASEDLSSGGAASSGGSGINEPNIELINNFGRRLRTLSNRRNNSLLVKKNKKKNKKLNISLNTSASSKPRLNSGIKRTNELLKSAKSPNNAGGKMMTQKLKLLDLQKNGRSERLCSMPGYNLLSENEKKLISSIDLKPSDYIMFKTNLIKNSLARRKQKTVNQSITSYFNNCPKYDTSGASAVNLNETCPNSSSTNGNPMKASPMMLRRYSLTNENEETNGTAENLANEFAAVSSAIKDSSLNGTESSNVSVASPSKKSRQNSKFMTILMKTTCPKYYQIPNSSRKRILRFLCDNGWIDVT